MTPAARAGRGLARLPGRGARRARGRRVRGAPAGSRRTDRSGPSCSSATPPRSSIAYVDAATTARRSCGSSSPLVAVVVLLMFVASLAGQPLAGFAALQVPLAEVFIWLLLLHAVDSPGPARPVHRAAREHRAAGGRRRALDLDGDRAVPRSSGPSARSPRSSLGQRAELAPLPDARRADAHRSARGRCSAARRPWSRACSSVVVLGAGHVHGRPGRRHRPVAHVPGPAAPDPIRPGARRALQPVARIGRPVAARPARAERGGRASFGYFGFSNQLDTAMRGRPDNTLVMRVRASAPDFWRGADLRHLERPGLDRVTRPGRSSIRGGQPIRIPRGPGRRAAGRASSTTDELVQTYYVEQPGPNAIFAAATPTQLYFPDRTVFQLPDGSLARRRAARQGQRLHRRQPSDGSRPSTRLRASDPARRCRANIRAAVRVAAGHRRDRARALAAQVTATAPTTYDKVLALERWMGAHTKYTLDIPPLPAGRGRGRPVPVRRPARLLRADRHEPRRDAALARHPGPAGGRVRDRRAQPVHRALRGAGQGRPRLGRGLLPGRRLAGLRPDRAACRSPATRRSTAPAPARSPT